MSEKKRLSGFDGKVYNLPKGTPITGDGSTVFTKGDLYLPIAMGTSTGFPDNAEIGYAFFGDGVSIATTNDKYYKLEFNKDCSITNCTVEFNKEELDQTTICDGEDGFRKYRVGFTDASGSIEGILTLDLSEKDVAKFVKVQKQDATGEITTIERNDDTVILALELNKIDNSNADRALFVAPVVITSYNLGVQIGENQTFSSNFRIAQDNEIKPLFIEADKALFA